MIRRLFYVLFVVTLGWPFMVVKWVVLGTKGSRDRRKMIRLQKKQNRLLKQARPEPPQD